MKNAFGWITKVADLATKNALTIIAQNLAKLDFARVTALETFVGIPETGAEPAGFITDAENLNALGIGVFHSKTGSILGFKGIKTDGVNNNLILLDADTEIIIDVNSASEFVKGIVELATSGESTAGLAIQANDTRLTNARTPLPHAASHEAGGSDVVAAGEIRTTTGPTDLVVGAIADGLFLKRVGATIVGAAAGGGGGSASLTQASVNLPFPAKRFHKNISILDPALTGTEKLGFFLASIAPTAENSEDMVDLDYMYGAAEVGGASINLKFKTPFAGVLSLQYLVG